MGTMPESSFSNQLSRRGASALLLGSGAVLSMTRGAFARDEPKLAELAAKFAELKLAALIVSRNGRRIHAEGDLSKPFLLHSMRKSFISMLYGIAVQNGDIHMDDTLAKLDIDDIPALTAVEKSATVRNLLKARSGVYIPAAAEAPSMKARRPARGSHAPDTFWYYNNWDFNALGHIYEMQTGKSVFIGLEHWIADPIGFEDFDTFDNAFYDYEEGVSQFPAYHMLFSARDLERTGLMLLNDGTWSGKQILPASWIAESSYSYSRTNYDDALSGYGYLWWIAKENTAGAAKPVPPDAFTAAGAGGHYMTVIPSLRMLVIVHVDDENVDSPLNKPPNYCKFLLDVMSAVT